MPNKWGGQQVNAFVQVTQTSDTARLAARCLMRLGEEMLKGSREATHNQQGPKCLDRMESGAHLIESRTDIALSISSAVLKRCNENRKLLSRRATSMPCSLRLA